MILYYNIGMNIEEKIIDLYTNKKMSYRDISNVTGVNLRTISKILNESNIPIRNLCKKEQDDLLLANKDNILSLYDNGNGMSYRGIAEIYNCNKRKIGELLKNNRAKIIINKRKRDIDFDYDIAYKLYCTELKSISEIADMYALSTSAIRKRLRRLGIEIRKNSNENIANRPNVRNINKEEWHKKVLNFIKDKEATYMDGDYIDCTSPYIIKCDKGHIFESNWNKMQRGLWCKYCGGTARLTIDDVRDSIKDRGIKLISTEYINRRTIMEWECELGHIWESDYDHVRRGQGCKVCNLDYKIDIGKIREAVENRGWELLSDSYTSSTSKYTIRCNNGHTISLPWSSISRDVGCSYCYGNKKSTVEDIKLLAEDNELELIEISDTNTRAKSVFRCKKSGHTFEAKPNTIQQSKGKACPRCHSSNISLQQKEVTDFVEEIQGSNTLCNTKPLTAKDGQRLELDIYIPDKSFAIEYHGLVWHSERPMFGIDKEKFKKLHKTKYKLSKESGIKLVQIFEDEWRDKKEICKSIIRNKLGITLNKIYARKCELRIVSGGEGANFFLENHISGSVKSLVSYGLYYNDELVSCISMRKPFTKNKEGMIEISRFASKIDTQVVGGFQKLLSAVVKWSKENGYSKILTYADCRFGSGDVYLKSGFTHTHTTNPNYYYEKRGIRENRFKHRKKKDISLGNTEREQNANSGWYAIYDAGNEAYELIL